MKKKNATNRLAFNKAAVVELNDTSMSNVHGGSTETVGITISLVIISMKIIDMMQEDAMK
ncbi:class I lanthipeptide [Flavobacterium sp. GCM10023249]|uniref:class I lanthipeptide n=1 Tax=unclassified Flavobacterium TaxID=196869 RepID=UPI003616E8E2